MRRLLANLVLLVTLWSYMAPASLAASEADLPACCRGNGKHHCAMAGMAKSPVGAPGFGANSPQCPYRMLGSVINASNVGEARKFFSLELPSSPLLPSRDLAFRASGARTRHSGRSPPSFSL